MAKKNQFYTVWKGRERGIFDSWESCKAQINGYEGAQYKGYRTRQEAEAALTMNYWQAIKGNERPSSTASLPYEGCETKPIMESLCVDAACSGNPGKMEYRGVRTKDHAEIFRKGVFDDATNNIGEFLALVHGLAYLKQIGSNIPIYSDSKTAQAWVRNKKCKSKLALTPNNVGLFDLIKRAEQWLNSNSYTTLILKWDTEQWGEIPADFGRK